MRIMRVFPRRTSATPADEMVRINEPPGLFDDADEVHVSVAFKWDVPRAEELARQWEHVAPVKVGGPAMGDGGGEFTPGMYLASGCVVTSRGCPNRCWFCDVWKREGGGVRELQIRDGFNVFDSNLLACSAEHIKAVFAMLARQPKRARFTGGLEAARLEPWHANELRILRPESLFFAYDEPADLEPLGRAAEILNAAGVPSGPRRCYVLCGYARDTIPAAEARMREAWDLGYLPQSMLYRSPAGQLPGRDWRKFHRLYARPAISRGLLKKRTSPLDIH